MNGNHVSDKNFGAPAGRSFGFDDTKYLWNRGHWKFIEGINNREVKAYGYQDGEEIFYTPESKNDAYTTDFITNCAIKYINAKAGSASRTPFTMMVSYPDPHGPHNVREPYNTMFDHLHFELPQSAKQGLKKQPAPPSWLGSGSKSMRKLIYMKTLRIFSGRQRQYFGMIKLLDDSIGRLLKTLEDNEMMNDTIVVFTTVVPWGSTLVPAKVLHIKPLPVYLS